MSYDGYFTRQEQQDALASRIEPNPNRVGSGFINFGEQVRQQQPTANWQMGSGGGGGGRANATPAGVSEIWNSAPSAPVQQPRAPHVQQPQQQAFAPPPPAAGASVPSVGNLFQSLGLDAAPAAPQRSAPQQQFGSAAVGASNAPFDVNAMSAAAMQQSFNPGSALQQPPPAAPGAGTTQSLMSLLQTPTSSAPPAQPLGSYNPLCNGSIPQQGGACASRAQAAFGNSIGAAPQCQLPPNGHSNAFAGGTFAGGCGSSVPNQQAARPVQQAPRGPPQSQSDYAAAAVQYKAPAAPRGAAVTTTVSVSRKPEASKPSPAAAAPKDEWECPRCTFLNNTMLRECEMCGFEKAGKQQVESPAQPEAEDDGWQTASSRQNAAAAKAAAAAAAPNAAANNKSKAQAKNEKRRAKKRGD